MAEPIPKHPAAGCESLRQMSDEGFYIVNEVVTRKLGHLPICKGDLHLLPIKVQRFVAEKAELMRPRGVYICDGSQHEADEITAKLIERGMLTPLKKMENCYLCRTDPKDTARVESKTWIVTPDRYQTECHVAPGVEPIMGHWMAPEQFSRELDSRFPGCMAGRMMYVIPYSMGPIGGPMSKIGVQLTDANYVVLSMRIMTRVSPAIWDLLGEHDFVRCIHSVGLPRPVMTKVVNHWPCNPERVMIAHRPAEREIWSYGSGYGGNSLLGKKCFALRIGCNIARDEGWLAEHMLIMGVTPPGGKERFITAAFPSACGKTNLAMLLPTLPGWRVQTCGDDIAWMRFGDDGRLYAMNPEAGFFGVAPGTSHKTNPMAMETLKANTMFTNVAETLDGSIFWEGMEDEVPPDTEVINWLGEQFKVGTKGKEAAQANSRFACPAAQCPIIHPKWEDPAGVPIEAIIFGGRRPTGVPAVFETFSWAHGIFVAACIKSEATAAAEFKGKQVMHDPFAMRPFMGYNFGKYMQHWLDLDKPSHKLPKIFNVNWFRKGPDGKFLWPGYCDNIRIIDWIIRRVDGEENFIKTAIGNIPKKGTINLEGLGPINWDELFSLPKDYWVEDCSEVRTFFDNQIGSDVPAAIRAEMDEQEKRIKAM